MSCDLQLASMWKRISAFLFDGILLCILATLLAWALSSVVQYDKSKDELQTYYDKYEAQYGVDFSMSLSEYEAMDEKQTRALEDAYAALGESEDARLAWDRVFIKTLQIISYSLVLAFLAMEFFVPLALGNGQTLGKKIFGIGLVSKSGIKIKRTALMLRVLTGKFMVETMIPVILLIMAYFGRLGMPGMVFLGAYLIAQIALPVFTRTHTTIHDLIALTVCVDIGSQRVFDTREDMLAFQEAEMKRRASSEEVVP